MFGLSWKAFISLVLVGATVLLCAIHIAVFSDAKTLFFYLALDIVFVPVQVLLVTVIIERLLSEREKQALMKKLNMVIGAFFSEVGNSLIRQLVSSCEDFTEAAQRLAISMKWSNGDFRDAGRFAVGHQCRFVPQTTQLRELREFLLARRMFILGLLQNPNLLEHNQFTDLLWAVSHLTEELEARRDIASLPATDVEHLKGDMARAYGSLTREWLAYMEHLKTNYPYMYSLAVRMNPYRDDVSPVVS
jgi:hypothetical protein